MKKRGFTLVEIMIVVAIIALLAAIAIPNLLGARKTANDAAARANLRTLSTELETYAAGIGNGAYPTGVDANGFVGHASAAAAKYCNTPCTTATTGCGGFYYACTVAAGSYSIVATPVTPGTTGTVALTVTAGGGITP
jgi:prepilin-type N-terminal cleavage/methylation domain-containing protein